MKIRIILDIEDHSQSSSYALATYCRDGRTLNTHPRTSKESKYHDRIKYKIDDRTKYLSYHTVHCTTCRLQESLKCHLESYTKSTAAAHLQIFRSVLDNLRIICLAHHKCSCKKQSYYQKYHISYRLKKYSLSGNLICPVKLLLTKGLGYKRIKADSQS